MRPRSVDRSGQQSDYQRGFAAGVLTTLILVVGGVSLFELVEWANSTAVVPAVVDFVTRPVFSLYDVLGLLFAGLLAVVIVAMLSRYRGVSD